MSDLSADEMGGSIRRVLLPSLRGEPGAMPGTIVVDPLAPAPKIRVIGYDRDSVSEFAIDDVAELTQHVDRHLVTWINVDGLGDAETLRQLSRLFNIHSLAIEDVAHVHQRAKVEEYDDHIFIVARMLRTHGDVLTEQVSLVFGENFVLSFQEQAGDCFDPVRERIRKKGTRLRQTGADFLAYAILDAIIDGYFPALEAYGERIEDVESQLLTQSTPQTATLIHGLKGELNAVRKAIWPHREAINTLMRDSMPLVSDETRIHLRDCYDHTIQVIDIAETCREMCADLRDLQFSQISMRQNEIMKVLTITATLFIPLGFIAGLYGMNFDTQRSPWNMPELSWFYGYPFALGLMVAVAAGMLIFFWWRGWIGSRRD